jgi:hypothetical protein
MALTWQGYASLVEANNFFEQRLRTFAWDNASANDRVRANNEAYAGINMFNYIGEKYPVAQVLVADPDASEETLQAAYLTQDGEFPRGDSTVVPKEIEYAQFLWAYALLDGRVPEEDFEQLAVTSQAYGGVRQAYNRQIAMDHLAHLVPSPQAFNYLSPWFRNDWGFCLIKV